MQFIPTADLCDEEEKNQCLVLKTILLKDYGGKSTFFGEIMTVRCYEDNTLVSKTLDEPGNGRVLFVDGGGSTSRALFGDQLGAKALKNHWAGVVINGAIRDTAQLKTMDIGVKALGTCPRKSNKRETGEKNVTLECFGVVIQPGMVLISDEDGVVILPRSKL